MTKKRQFINMQHSEEDGQELSPYTYHAIKLRVHHAQPTVPRLRQVRARKKRRIPIWVRIMLAVLFLLLVVLGSGAWYYYANLAGPLSHITGQTVRRFQDDVPSSHKNAPTGALISGRINILLLGSDTDSKFSVPLAQTDIVLTIDPQTKYVGMLSLPRDLWIQVPGHGMQKLDQAFADGWNDGQSFDSAVRLSLETIHRDFGIYIDHYAWVGLAGFMKVIDTVGGVDIDTTHPIVDDTYPDDIGTGDPNAYRRLYIAPGPQHLTGLEALQYVRSRHADLVGDFGRSARQQQVLSQLKTKLDTPGTLTRLPELANDLNGYVKTDMQLPDILNLMNFARSVDPARINRVILSPPYSASFVTSDGQDALRPNCALIAPVIAKMFTSGIDATCDTLPLAASSLSVLPIALTNTPPLPGASMFSAMIAVAPQTDGGSSGNTPSSGIHSLLDLVFLTTFESFDAVKV